MDNPCTPHASAVTSPSYQDLTLPLDLMRLAEQTASRRRALGWLTGSATWGPTACGRGGDESGTGASAGSRCVAFAGHAIDLRHSHAQGRQSMCSAGVMAENHLRGVQVTGSGNLFGDSVTPQLASVGGNVTDGHLATLDGAIPT